VRLWFILQVAPVCLQFFRMGRWPEEGPERKTRWKRNSEKEKALVIDDSKADIVYDSRLHAEELEAVIATGRNLNHNETFVSA
jgi:hypothetical protein